MSSSATPEPAPTTLLGRIAALGRRVTSGGTFLPEIDGLRFIAIAWVLIYHLAGEYAKVRGADFAGQIDDTVLSTWIHTLNFGVQLFFVISGFILGLPFVRHHYEGRERPQLKLYYIRRLTRIEPPLLINLTICLGLLVVVKHQSLMELLPHYLASITYSHNLIYGEMSTINFVTWSLEIEAQFYLLAPFLVSVLALPARWREGALAALIAASGLAAWYLMHSHPLIERTILGQVQYFLAGILLAAWYCRNQATMHTRSLGNDLIAVGAWCVLAWLLAHKAAWNAPLLPFAVLIAYMAMLRGRITRALITWGPVPLIGGMCYTIYLYHPFLKSALKHLTFPLQVTDIWWVNLWLQIILLGGLIVGVCWVLFLLFEKPFMYREWPARVGAFIRRLLGRPTA